MFKEYVDLKQADAALRKLLDIVLRKLFPAPSSAGYIRERVDHRIDRLLIEEDRRPTVMHLE
ncbi:MAG TPA: hypothetical protein DEO88_10050 [Syntrophobacteraceae bacterium]|nr:hypothetical protein [Syntrophobacteraceae bacterium]